MAHQKGVIPIFKVHNMSSMKLDMTAVWDGNLVPNVIHFRFFFFCLKVLNRFAPGNHQLLEWKILLYISAGIDSERYLAPGTQYVLSRYLLTGLSWFNRSTSTGIFSTLCLKDGPSYPLLESF